MKNELLHGRQRQLFALLKSQQKVVTSKEIASQLEVSDRTVRNDIHELNKMLAPYGAMIETIRGKGLFLKIPEEASPILSDMAHTPDTLQTREGRANYLLVKLLLSDIPLQIGEVEDEMFISRTTLENDIRYIRKIVVTRRPNLFLNRKENRISIETSEWNRRLVLAKIFSESWDYHSREGVFLQGTHLNPDAFHKILELTKDVVRGSNIKVDDYDLIALVFYIAISDSRIRTGHPLDGLLNTTPDLSAVQDIVNDLMDRIEAQLQIPFDTVERTGVMISLSFRQYPLEMLNDPDNILRYLDQNALKTAKLFLRKIHEEYGADFSQDKRLYMDLAFHIFRLEKRLRYSYERLNPMLSAIKSRFVFFFELSMTIRTCFQTVYGMSIGEDEWGYFADILIASSHRIAEQNFPNGVPIAFVSHLGRSDRDMLASQIRSVYGNTIDLRGPYSIYERDQITSANPQIILSTVRLETVRAELVNIPHLTVPASFGDEDFLQLNLLLRECREFLFFPKLSEHPGRYFNRELFFIDREFSSEQEVIIFLTHNVARLGYATTEFQVRALEREELSSTATGNGVAVPRAISPGPCKTIISFLQLRKPITWGTQKVGTVFLLSVAETDLPIFGTLLNYIVTNLCSRQKKKKIEQIRSFDDFIKLL